MKSLSAVLNQKFDFNISDWQKLLRQELKTDQIDSKTVKKYLDLGSFPTLSLDSLKVSHINSTESWKKASQTYLTDPDQELIEEDVQNGVKVFFFNSYSAFTPNSILINKLLDSDCEVYCLNKANLQSNRKFKVFHEQDLILARDVQDRGGSSTLELAWIAAELTKKLNSQEWRIGIFLGSDIFKTVAKLRAARLLAMKIQTIAKVNIPIKIIGLTSYRDWTAFERYSNILRNDAQVMAGYLGGADVVQSSGYNSIIEIESDSNEDEHLIRSHRMSRNTCHILSLESMLGIVEDPASGSFHLEGLTQRYAETSWSLMQDLLKSVSPEKLLTQKIEENRNDKTLRMKTRKDIMAGTNDYPDVKEKLHLKLVPKFYRSAYVFEELRLRLDQVMVKPEVEVVLKGSYSELSPRINFIKNYFELIGLHVIDPMDFKQTKKGNIVVLCGKDEDYPELAKSVDLSVYFEVFIAGKVEVSHVTNIFVGQNIYEILEKLVKKLEVNS